MMKPYSVGAKRECRYCAEPFTVPRRGPRAYCGPECVAEAERRKHRRLKREKYGRRPWVQYLEEVGKVNRNPEAGNRRRR